jgi:hypothetical protein
LKIGLITSFGVALNKHSNNLKRIIFIFTLLYSSVTFGQTNCAMGFNQNSNKISYDQKEIESIIEPQKYDAFFLGESHTIDFEPEFKYNFIKHLNSKYAVRHIFMEIGHSSAYFFNQFLQTGDTTILKENPSPYLMGQYKIFWRELYEYNRILPDTLKIFIHGIDFERNEIFRLLEKTKSSDSMIPVYLRPTFLSIQNLSLNKDLLFWNKEFKNELSKLKMTFLNYEDDFKKIYKNNFDVVKNALTNEVPITTKVNPRNKIWLENIKEIIVQNNITKFIGFFGASHTMYNNSTSLTVTLKNSDFFKGKILNIATIYNHFTSTNGANQIVEYGYKEKEIFDIFYDKSCRAVIIKSSNIPKTTSKSESDFVIFAKEIIDR